MSTITDLNVGDTGATSRTVINANFDNLNTDKIETSVISTDGTLAGNSDTELPTEKAVKTYVDAQASTIAMESTAGVTHSLATVASQVVFVVAKGWMQLNSASTSDTVLLKYNGVTKDQVDVGTASTNNSVRVPFCLTYTETPGAATANITVTATNYTPQNVVIMVQKIS